MNIKWVLTLIVLFFVFLVAAAPARVVYSLMPANPKLKVIGLSDSIWNGSAQTVKLDRLYLDRVSWDINPFSLFIGRLSGYSEIRDDKVDFSGHWSLGLDNQLSMTDVELSIPASLVAANVPTRGMQIGGEFEIKIKSLEFDREQGPQNVEATLFWLNSSASYVGQPVTLGNFKISAKSLADGQLEFSLMPSNNQIDAQGKALFKWPGTLAVDVSVSENVPESLKSSIAFLQKGEGNRRVFKTTIPLVF